MLSKQLSLVREEIAHLNLIESMLEGKVEFYNEYIKLGKKPKNYDCKALNDVQNRIKKALNIR